jgi:hypothetical protein
VGESNLNGFQNIRVFDAIILYAASNIADQLRFLGTANGAIQLWRRVKRELLATVEADERNELPGPTV